MAIPAILFHIGIPFNGGSLRRVALCATIYGGIDTGYLARVLYI